MGPPLRKIQPKSGYVGFGIFTGSAHMKAFRCGSPPLAPTMSNPTEKGGFARSYRGDFIFQAQGGFDKSWRI